MSNRIDLTGNKYNMLTVIDFSHKVGRKSYWNCLCECGKSTTVRSDCLKDSNTKSCGCLNLKPTVTRHNESRTKLYGVWSQMKTRCLKEYHTEYSNYGGRGISVCKEWLDYENFRDWANSNGYNKGLTIDRINVNGNYEPNNCRWISNELQQLNKRTNVILNYEDKSMTIKEWSNHFNLNYMKLYNALRKVDYNLEEALALII
ncbi:hypothetical protein ACQKNX_07555 [Lysinibacillus sp. NPDC093712]|uniref:hypothetical protein n=1 Tax=Lysinibacillus sp. NPDC093712 TaxID=3390579 RepID=UPI003D0171B4